MTAAQIDRMIINVATQEGVPAEKSPIIAMQARHETANYTSNVLKQANNLFGMKMPSIRPKTFILGPSSIVMKSEGSTPYAAYSSLENSVRDLVAWHKYNKTDWNKITGIDSYSRYLKSKGYYGSTIDIYIRGLKNAAKKMSAIISANPGASMITIIAAVVTVFF